MKPDPVPSALLIVSVAILAMSPAHAADPIPLRAGPLSMVFEPDNAFLRYVKLGPHDVLLGINAPIRNEAKRLKRGAKVG